MKTRIIIFLILVFAFGVRVYDLGIIPVSLHGDEIGVGYNAFSLLKNGIDEYGKVWPFVFRADVTPLIFYTTIPSIFLFGLSEFAIRFPSVIVGISTIFVFFVFFIEFLRVTKIPLNHKKLALFASLLLAISPWHIQISRIAHDGSYGLFFSFLGLFLFFRWVNSQKNIFCIFSFIMFGLSFYAYHAPRLTTPLLIGILLFAFRNFAIGNKKIFCYSIMLFSIVIFPIVIDFISKPLGSTRFGGINIFIREPNSEFNLIEIPIKIIINYIYQFDLRAFFLDASHIRYLNVKNTGLLPVLELPFIFIGLLYALMNRQLRILIMILLLSPLPGALTQGSLNAGRNVLMFPFLHMLSAFGFVLFLKLVQGKKIIVMILGLFLALNSSTFLKNYFIDGGIQFQSQWQYGVKQLALTVTKNEAVFDKIVVSENIKQAYIYILFYGEKSPLWLLSVNKERHPFIGYSKIDKYEFRKINWNDDLKQKNILLAAFIHELPCPSLKNIIQSDDKKFPFAIIDTSNLKGLCE